MNKFIWVTKVTIENLNHQIGHYEARGEYSKAEALRDMFPRDIDEDQIKKTKQQFAKYYL